MPGIRVIQPEEADGELKKIYDQILKSRGKIAEIHKIQSLNPPTITAHMDLYMSIMFGKSPLKRPERELIAVVVSVANNCPYCIEHHSEALNHYWKDRGRIKKLVSDFHKAGLTDRELIFCEYADNLSLRPSTSGGDQEIDELRNKGLTDREILDCNLITSYFNFANRIILGLNVELEKHPGGYKY